MLGKFFEMFNLIEKSNISEHNHNGNTLKILELRADEFDNLVGVLIDTLPNNYVSPESISDTLERLGKSAAAQKLRIKLPEVKNIRSGDIGEVLAFDYIEDSTVYSVPIHKLRWRDHRNMAMRGDDIIGISVFVSQEQQTIQFLKAEAKSYKSLSTKMFQDARKELDNDDGLPAPHALSFISERLRETGQDELSNLLEKIQLVDGISSNQVEHLLFTFTASNPATLQKESFEAYEGNIKQSSVGFRVRQHQELIAGVFEGVINALDN